MNEFLDGMNLNLVILISCVMNVILLIWIIVNSFRINTLNKRYNSFMKKLGNGTNIEEILKGYIESVKMVNDRNEEIVSYCKRLDDDMSKCIQKIGIVRYSAFKDTGSDLSFALALLDDNNDGVVLNGIYSREMSNIYAKPIEKGISKYTVSEEEKEAIKRAIDSDGVHKVR